MSTTINILPVETVDITFAQVITIAENHINNFLHNMGLTHTVKLAAKLHGKQETYIRDIKGTDVFEWRTDEYVWFSVVGIAGGTDAYCEEVLDNVIDPENPWWRLNDIEDGNKTIDKIADKLARAKTLNRVWSFRRSAGQPGIIALSYGLIAAAVAELTHGILWSDDGAWDHKRFPAEYKSFLDWYFFPDKALNPENADWAMRCIAGIEAELTASNTSPKGTYKWWQKLFKMS